jgi:hypothetical protein
VVCSPTTGITATPACCVWTNLKLGKLKLQVVPRS